MKTTASRRFFVGRKTPRSCLLPWLLLVLTAGFREAGTASADVTATEGTIEIPTYPWDPPVRHPYFRETDGRNIYPYPMMDNLTREKEPRTWRTVVLENEYLRVTFLPELGGKVHEVHDKTTDKPVFYVNHVVKPGLIGQCGAWVAGGIEFNTGPAGHTVSAVLPVDVEILPRAPDGSRSVAVGEVERIYGTRWTVVVTLRPGRSYLEEAVRIYNRTELVRPYYFWNCTAVPNTPGFRFVYPMTLGTDHAGTSFYTWPVSDGKDLRLGRSYRDASSIFAYKCDQDFFGSYDEDADRGVVACANHHLLPGKKAWTWGQGSYGTMHQMDLTDEDGPYNEVQTGPLPTQADVGRLDPHEAVAWKEWWYPVHGLGGFTFANPDVAVNAERQGGALRLRMLGTAIWDGVKVLVRREGKVAAHGETRLGPGKVSDVTLSLAEDSDPLTVELLATNRILARFRVPLDLPVRTPPEPAGDPQTASELAQDGWQEILFARFPKAEARFVEALERAPSLPDARCGLAFLSLDRSPPTAASEARAALAVNPDHGLARYALAVAQLRSGDEKGALASAWKASLDPATAVAGRVMAARLLIRRGGYSDAVEALEGDGPWRGDPLARNVQALALWKLGESRKAAALAEQNLETDPLDALARAILWLTGREDEPLSLERLLYGRSQSVLELAATFVGLAQERIALRVLESFYLGKVGEARLEPIPCYWGWYLCDRLGRSGGERYLKQAKSLSADGVFPHRHETVAVLRHALEHDPRDGKAALYLGHLLFSVGAHEEGRRLWRQASGHDEVRVIAARALGMASLKLDDDAGEAEGLLEDAHASDPGDVIVARDLARVLFTRVEEAPDEETRHTLLLKARDILEAASAAGRIRSDYVALLARAHNRLGEHEKAAELLDSVRITIWEGAREVHRLFEEAHLALGRTHLEAGRAGEALWEFNRALEYPENLATGKLEHTREAHIHYLRGRALEALGRKEAAREAWKKAAEEAPSGDSEKEKARKAARKALEEMAQERVPGREGEARE